MEALDKFWTPITQSKPRMSNLHSLGSRGREQPCKSENLRLSEELCLPRRQTHDILKSLVFYFHSLLWFLKPIKIEPVM